MIQNILLFSVIPEEDMETLDGGSTEGIFSRGGGRGMPVEEEEEEVTRGCRMIVGAWTMPGRPLC